MFYSGKNPYLSKNFDAFELSEDLNSLHSGLSPSVDAYQPMLLPLPQTKFSFTSITRKNEQKYRQNKANLNTSPRKSQESDSNLSIGSFESPQTAKEPTKVLREFKYSAYEREVEKERKNQQNPSYFFRSREIRSDNIVSDYNKAVTSLEKELDALIKRIQIT